MKGMQSHKLASCLMGIFIASVMFSACGRNSSPEGRMTMKIDNLQKALIDSLQQQHKAILDSMAAMRKDIQALQQMSK